MLGARSRGRREKEGRAVARRDVGDGRELETGAGSPYLSKRSWDIVTDDDCDDWNGEGGHTVQGLAFSVPEAAMRDLRRAVEEWRASRLRSPSEGGGRG